MKDKTTDKKKIIDYGPLNDAIKNVENTIAEYNHEERELIINHVRIRIIKEAMDNLPLGLGKLMKKTAKDFEED